MANSILSIEVLDEVTVALVQEHRVFLKIYRSVPRRSNRASSMLECKSWS